MLERLRGLRQIRQKVDADGTLLLNTSMEQYAARDAAMGTAATGELSTDRSIEDLASQIGSKPIVITKDNVEVTLSVSKAPRIFDVADKPPPRQD